MSRAACARTVSRCRTGRFYDLVELDAASNNGVEAMRELIQGVHLGVGASSRRKVYIIDEVHMLSAAASNTLLKTLEEPPAHVVFVLATTDPHKVLPTIRSRTQHFEFTLLTARAAPRPPGRHPRPGGRRRADEAVLDLIVRRAAGSARDALSLLDQALAVGGGSLDTDAVQAALGGAPFDLRLAVIEAIAAEDVAGALVGVHDMLAQGHDVRRVADDMLRTLRDAFLAANAGARVPYDGPAEEAEKLASLAQTMGNALVVRGIEIFGQSIVDIRQQTVADPRLVLEVAVVRVARREARTSVETLLERVERLERQIGSGGSPATGSPATGSTATGSTATGPTGGNGDDAPEATPASATVVESRSGVADAREGAQGRPRTRNPRTPNQRTPNQRSRVSAARVRATGDVVRGRGSRRRDRGVAGRARRVEGAVEGGGATRPADRRRGGRRRVRRAARPLRRDQRPLPQRSRHDQVRVLRPARVPAPLRVAASRLRRRPMHCVQSSTLRRL